MENPNCINLQKHIDISLRDFFAGLAMQGLVAAEEGCADKIAMWAYQQADAMLAFRDGLICVDPNNNSPF